MDAQLAPGFQKELPVILERVVEDLAQMLDVAIAIDTTTAELCPLAEVFTACGDGAVCCRSIFVRKVNGVGGVLLPEEAADHISRAALMMDPPTEGEPFDFPSVGREALEEIFNIIVGSWNTSASPDYRLRSRTEERSVEHYPTSVPFPDTAGVYPAVVRYPLSFSEYVGFIYFFVPIKAVHGRDVAAFIPPVRFVKETAPSPAPAGATGGLSNEPSDGVRTPFDGPLKPVVFLDYTGQILRWLRTRAAQPHLALTMTPRLDPPPADHLPAATILVGISPEALGNLPETSYVEIRTREKDPV